MKAVVIGWAAALALACAGCAGSSDGGPVGSGISAAAVSGNIVVVDSTATQSTLAELPPVAVSIDQAPAVATTTDASGNFELRGDFAGTVTLRFRTPQFEVTQPLDVPAGSTVVLQDIELRPDGVDVQAARQLDLVGRVDMIDCADGTILVDDSDHNELQFMVRIDSNTSIVKRNGDTATCADIQVGQQIGVQGAIALQTDRTITALSITLAPPPANPQQITHNVPFIGLLAAIDCADGVLVVDDTVHRSRIELSGSTAITRPGGATLQCGDLRVGDHVVGRGTLDLRMPGLIQATQILVVPDTRPGEAVPFVGFVEALDCSTGVLQLDDFGNSVIVRILPSTVIVRPNQQPLTCTQIAAGSRVNGSGVLENAGSSIDAIELTVRHGNGNGNGNGNGMGHSGP